MAMEEVGEREREDGTCTKSERGGRKARSKQVVKETREAAGRRVEGVERRRTRRKQEEEEEEPVLVRVRHTATSS